MNELIDFEKRKEMYDEIYWRVANVWADGEEGRGCTIKILNNIVENGRHCRSSMLSDGPEESIITDIDEQLYLSLTWNDAKQLYANALRNRITFDWGMTLGENLASWCSDDD